MPTSGHVSHSQLHWFPELSLVLCPPTIYCVLINSQIGNLRSLWYSRWLQSPCCEFLSQTTSLHFDLHKGPSQSLPAVWWWGGGDFGSCLDHVRRGWVTTDQSLCWNKTTVCSNYIYSFALPVNESRLPLMVLSSSVPVKQVRLVSVKAERPNHPSRPYARQGGIASQGGGGLLHNNDNNTDMTP